jgi:hypothetical protein
MQCTWRWYAGFRKHPMRNFGVAVAFHPSRLGTFAALANLADDIGHTDVETESMRSWFTK